MRKQNEIQRELEWLFEGVKGKTLTSHSMVYSSGAYQALHWVLGGRISPRDKLLIAAESLLKEQKVAEKCSSKK